MKTHSNNIGPLRLFFAYCVIIGHAPEMIDGNRMREPLTMLFHSLSLGEVAVDAFFILSGYLITRSCTKSSSYWDYIKKRVLRIYPAFICASFITVFVYGPAVGVNPWWNLPGFLSRILLLREPAEYPGQFPGLLHLSILNGSMWTIKYEFKCYLLIILIDYIGILRNRNVLFWLTLSICFSSFLITFEPLRTFAVDLDGNSYVRAIAGTPLVTARLTSAFMVGSCWYLFSDKLMYMNFKLAISSLLISLLMLYDIYHTAEIGLIIFGGFFLYWLCFKANFGKFRSINDGWDISYGVYLYGWPLGIYFAWRFPHASPWAIATITVLLSTIAGVISWFGVEQWSKGWFRKNTNNLLDHPSNNVAIVSREDTII